jgi:hypothetical protein
MQSNGINGYQFTSRLAKDPQNLVRLLAENKGIFNGGITICIRSHFQYWNERSIFNSTNIQLVLKDFQSLAGAIRIETSFYNYRWPEKINLFTAFNSFCIAIDTTKGMLSLAINGKAAFNIEDKNLLQNLSLSDNTFYDVGTYSGKFTDFYAWNVALNGNQMQDYYESRMESLPLAAVVNWINPVILFIGNSTKEVQLQQKDLYSSSLGRHFILSVI